MEDDRPQRKIVHLVGEPLDQLSVADFDDRIALLRTEIERLQQAKIQKQGALDQAGSIFKRS